MSLSEKIKGAIHRLTAIAISPGVKIIEKQIFKNLLIKLPQELAPIFIIGAPRTGSTILYQSITNFYDVKYIDNTACRWHRNLLFGMWLSHRKYNNIPHDNFSANHGSTVKFGSHAPSECGEFWYRWLPKSHHFIDHSEITDRIVKEIKQEVEQVTVYFQKPLLFKNLNVGQRLRLIHRAFPNARIIYIRRDPRFVVRSIAEARKKVGIGKGEWWSIMPSNITDLLDLPEEQMCAAQVYYIEKQIEEDLSLFPQKNVKTIHYQELSKHIIHEIGTWLGMAPRPGGSIPEFIRDNPNRLSESEINELQRITDHYPFKKELFV